jgi:uncharacterized protein (DUF1778 family)
MFAGGGAGVAMYGDVPYVCWCDVEAMMRAPKYKEPRKERLEARLTGSQKELLLRAAALRGQSLTDFVVSAASETARGVVRDYDVLELSRRDQVAFAKKLLAPEPANAKLKEAVAEYLAGEAE